MGKKSRNKGYRVERELVLAFREAGLKALRVPLSGAAEGFEGDLLVEGMAVEVKARHDGFKEIYKWLEDKDLLALKADRKEFLIVMRLEEFIKLLKEVKRNV